MLPILSLWRRSHVRPPFRTQIGWILVPTQSSKCFLKTTHFPLFAPVSANINHKETDLERLSYANILPKAIYDVWSIIRRNSQHDFTQSFIFIDTITTSICAVTMGKLSVHRQHDREKRNTALIFFLQFSITIAFLILWQLLLICKSRFCERWNQMAHQENGSEIVRVFANENRLEARPVNHSIKNCLQYSLVKKVFIPQEQLDIFANIPEGSHLQSPPALPFGRFELYPLNSDWLLTAYEDCHLPLQPTPWD